MADAPVQGALFRCRRRPRCPALAFQRLLLGEQVPPAKQQAPGCGHSPVAHTGDSAWNTPAQLAGAVTVHVPSLRQHAAGAVEFTCPLTAITML